MKDRLFITITLICALALSLFPATPISAAEHEVWVLVDTQFEPPEQYLEWQLQFMDIETTYTITMSETEFTYRYRINGDMGTTADVFFEYTFDTPPEELIPGKSISLAVAGSVTGTAYTLNKMTLMLSLQEWTKGNVIKSTVAEIELTLDELDSQDSQRLQFVVPETFDGKLVINTRNNIAAQARILWFYEPGESQATSPDETTKTGPTVISQEEWEKMKEDVASQSHYGSTPWIAEMLEEGYIGMVISATGDYDLTDYSGREMRNSKPWIVERENSREAFNVQFVRIGDTIQTGEDGRLRIQLFDRDEARNAVPSVIYMASNSELHMNKFLASFDAHSDPKVRQERETFISLIRGGVKAFLSGWGRNSSVKMEAGVIICGIRGSDVFISYDPVTERVDAYVIEGHMDVTNPETGEIKSLTDNQKLMVENGNIGEIQPMSQQEWDSLVKDNGLEDMQLISQEEMEKLFQEDGQGTGSGINPVIYVVIGIIILATAYFGLRRLNKKAA